MPPGARLKGTFGENTTKMRSERPHTSIHQKHSTQQQGVTPHHPKRKVIVNSFCLGLTEKQQQPTTLLSYQRSIMAASNGDPVQEDELERMLEEAERLANKIRAAAAASQSQSGNSSEQQGRPSPPHYPPRDPSGSTIDTHGVPIDTVQVPHNPPMDDDALTLSSNVHIANPFDQVATGGTSGELQQQHPHYSSHQHSDADMEAALRATQNMEKALQALGAGMPDSSGTDAAMAATTTTSSPTLTPKSPPALTLRNSTMSSTTKTPSPRPPPPPPATSSSLLPKEGDDDYVPMKDYSFKPSRFVPDTDVNWEEVDTANENDDDFVPLRDYSSSSSVPVASSGAMPQANGGRRRRFWTRRRKRRAAVGGLIMLVLLLGIAYSFHGQSVQSEEAETVEHDNNSTAPTAYGGEPIQVKPLDWAATRQLEDVPLDTEAVALSLEEFMEEEDSYFAVIDIEPARNIKCTIPLAWLVLRDCHPTATVGDRLEAVLQSMLI